jgi:hypothetical protein
MAPLGAVSQSWVTAEASHPRGAGAAGNCDVRHRQRDTYWPCAYNSGSSQHAEQGRKPAAESPQAFPVDNGSMQAAQSVSRPRRRVLVVIQSGTIHLGIYSADSEGWSLHVPVSPEELGSGEERSFRTADIQFPTPFASAPKLVLSLAGLDAGNQANVRITLHAEDVQREEFNIRVVTWGDSLVYGLAVTWLAHD